MKVSDSTLKSESIESSLITTSAGEEPIIGADGRHLSRSIRNRGKVDPIFVEGVDGVPAIVKEVIMPNDILMTQGAGNVGGLAIELAKRKLS